MSTEEFSDRMEFSPFTPRTRTAFAASCGLTEADELRRGGRGTGGLSGLRRTLLLFVDAKRVDVDLVEGTSGLLLLQPMIVVFPPFSQIRCDGSGKEVKENEKEARSQDSLKLLIALAETLKDC